MRTCGLGSATHDPRADRCDASAAAIRDAAGDARDWVLDSLCVALVQMRDSDGLEGLGYACVVNRRYLAPLVAMVRGLSEMLVVRIRTP